MKRATIINDWRHTLILILILAPAAPAIADAAVDAKRAYSAKDYNKAAALFASQIHKNPRDAMLHYYYGNCLVGKGDNSEAAAEYSIASQLFKDRKMKDYCENLSEHFQYHPPAEASQFVSPNIPEKIIHNGGDPAKQERIRAVLRRGEEDAGRALSNSERQITPLYQEKGAISSYGSQTNRAGTPNLNSDQMTDANQRIDDRVQELRDQAQKRAQDIRERARKDAERISE